MMHLRTSRRVDGWWCAAWHRMVRPMAALIELVGSLVLRESATPAIGMMSTKKVVGTYVLGSAGRGSVQK
jgi:hypothetical protein